MDITPCRPSDLTLRALAAAEPADLLFYPLLLLVRLAGSPPALCAQSPAEKLLNSDLLAGA